MLRVVADHADRRALEIFAREIAPAGHVVVAGHDRAGRRPAAVSPLVKPFSFLLDKREVPATCDRCAASAPPCRSTTSGGVVPAAPRAIGAARTGAARRRGDDARAADPARLGAQRRQGRRLQHRRRRPPRRVAAAALGARSTAGARRRLPRPSRARPCRALSPAGHRRDQLRAARGARRRRRRPRTGSIRSAKAWRSSFSTCRSRCPDRCALVTSPDCTASPALKLGLRRA